MASKVFVRRTRNLSRQARCPPADAPATTPDLSNIAKKHRKRIETQTHDEIRSLIHTVGNAFLAGVAPVRQKQIPLAHREVRERFSRLVIGDLDLVTAQGENLQRKMQMSRFAESGYPRIDVTGVHRQYPVVL
ncbi:MAG: hypothetical protein LBP86_01795, partial [Azoarcus sp.]|nr:hypothetical protein [Azoarcus sp.]